MTQVKCQHRGKLLLTPTEEKGFETIDWCYYDEKQIEDKCPADCPFRNMPAPRYN